MNLHHLKIFYFVAKYGSITKAAKELGLTKPAVSLQLNDCQNKYNSKLFDIKEKKIFLTNLGKEIFERCSTIFDIEKQVDNLISDYQNSKAGLVTIYSTEPFIYYYLPEIISKFIKKLPNIIPHIFTYNSARIVEKTVGLTNDIGFIGYNIEHPKLITKELLSESIHLICHPDHMLAKKHIIMPFDLESHNFITQEKGAGTRRSLDKYAENHNIKLNIIAEFSSPISTIGMVKQNLGISAISKNVALEAVMKKEIISIPLAGGCFRQFYLVYNKEKYLSDTIKAFISETETWCTNYNNQKLNKIIKPRL